jgi:hypothetical protein
MDDDKLPLLVEEVDETLLSWTLQNKITPDMMMAIVLARMTLVAKETNMEGSLIALLDKARHKLMEDTDNKKEVLH